MWGDWYAKDGNTSTSGILNTAAYNASIGTDPTTQFNYLDFQQGIHSVASEGGSWVLTPDTVSTVPLPAAAWLFGSALLGLAGIGYRRGQCH